MNWFQGEIAQAIVTSKSRGAIFVVYIEGTDNNSVQFSSFLNSNDISSVLNTNKFVAIKVAADSVPCRQFSQIYGQVTVPSLYFIGKTGAPLDVITQVADSKELQNKISAVLDKESGEKKPTNKEDVPVSSNPINQAETSRKSEEKQDNSDTKSNSEQKPSELEDERRREIERRKLGQDVQQLKRWQEDQKMKQLLEEREREKRESILQRQKVLEQIAQDKAERNARFAASTTPTPAQTEPKPLFQRRSSPNANSCRLQFKLPDGKTYNHDFANTDTLEAVHSYIKSNIHLGFSNYVLCTTFPKHEFTDSKRSQTLSELGLVPSAVLLILPMNGKVVSSYTGSGLVGMIWYILTPIFVAWDYIKSFIFGGNNTGGNDARQHQQPESAEKPERKASTRVKRGGDTTVIRRQGNVHRLANKSDSDDENNTWNGNSTQQM